VSSPSNPTPTLQPVAGVNQLPEHAQKAYAGFLSHLASGNFHAAQDDFLIVLETYQEEKKEIPAELIHNYGKLLELENSLESQR
jgi:hypothetical protein